MFIFCTIYPRFIVFCTIKNSYIFNNKMNSKKPAFGVKFLGDINYCLLHQFGHTLNLLFMANYYFNGKHFSQSLPAHVLCFGKKWLLSPQHKGVTRVINSTIVRSGESNNDCDQGYMIFFCAIQATWIITKENYLGFVRKIFNYFNMEKVWTGYDSNPAYIKNQAEIMSVSSKRSLQ
jgi:hypothetical protein